MKLYLVRHGEALAKDVDPDQSLSAAGRANVERLAAFVGWRGARAQRILHSGKARARQTAEILAEAMADAGACVARDGLAPNDPTAPVADEFAGLQEDTVLVGHLPFMGDLAARLVVGSEDVVVAAFRPATMVCLEHGVGGGWHVAWMLRPDMLDG